MALPLQRYRRIESIDMLRGIACLWIVVAHVYGTALERGHDAPGLFSGFAFLANGNNAVTFFLIISGFVLALPFYSGERLLENYADTLQYLRRRVRRIYPLILFSGVLLSIFALRTHGPLAVVRHFLTYISFSYIFTPPFYQY